MNAYGFRFMRLALKGVACFAALIGASSFWGAADSERPNVILIVADDLGWRDLSVQGSTFYESPNIDSIAASGMRFERGYATCQVCSPSRASLMTGRFPARVGITDWIGSPEGEAWKRNTEMLPAFYKHELPQERVTLAEAMKDGGYATFFAGKWHLGDREEDWPEHHGFEVNKGGHDKGGPPGGYFSPYQNPRLEDGPVGEYLPLRLGRETASFIEENAEMPFFVTLCFYSVHGPAQTTQSLWNKYRQKAMGLPTPAARFGIERRKAIRVVQDNPIYGGMIEAMDTAIGTVLAALERQGLRENTIVVFTSDNGGVASADHWATSNLPLRGGKGYQWEGGLRVPYIISWPRGVAPGVDASTAVTGADLYPTILDLVGLPLRPEEHVDGVSLRPALEGKEFSERPLFWHYPHYGNQGGDPSSVILSNDWKLIYYHESEEVELYRLAEDPAETIDVAANFPEKTQQLKGQLMAWMQEVDAKAPSVNPNYDAKLAIQNLQREHGANRKKLERAAQELFDPDWKPEGDWWEKTGNRR